MEVCCGGATTAARSVLYLFLTIIKITRRIRTRAAAAILKLNWGGGAEETGDVQTARASSTVRMGLPIRELTILWAWTDHWKRMSGSCDSGKGASLRTSAKCCPHAAHGRTDGYMLMTSGVMDPARHPRCMTPQK